MHAHCCTYKCVIIFVLFLGQPQSFTVSVHPANNFPADFYFLIDKSFSMNDDLQNLRNLSSQLGTCVLCMCVYVCIFVKHYNIAESM